MADIYRYVLMSDGGMAPNPRGAMLSLATCKPVVRSCAQVGDWVIANRSSPHNRLIVWAGKVSRIMSPDRYSAAYANREDALYHLNDRGELARIPKRRRWYHPTAEQQRKDIRGQVLLFDWDRCWYFGDDPKPYPEMLTHLIAIGQGHRKNGASAEDVAGLERWLTTNFRTGASAEPRNGWEGQVSKRCGPSPSGCNPRPRSRSDAGC